MGSILKRIYYLLKGYKVGKNVHFCKNVQIKGRRVSIGDDCYFDEGVCIQGDNISIGINCVFFKNVLIYAREFSIGQRGKISRNCVFKASKIKIGNELWCNEEVEIGGGGWQKSSAVIDIGDFTLIGKRAHLNVCREITIQGHSGIGMDCMLFTHSAGNGQSFLEGYSSVEGPICIGTNVSLYSRVIAAPGTNIGKGVTVGAGSYIRGELEDGSFYAGLPAKLIKKVQPLSAEASFQMLKEVFTPAAAITGGFMCQHNTGQIILVRDAGDAAAYLISQDMDVCVVFLKGKTVNQPGVTYINLESNTIAGKTSCLSEDVRDRLRRKGVILQFSNYKPPKLNALKLKRERIEL